MKLYVAASYDRLHEAQELAADLRGYGYEITSSWLEPKVEEDPYEHSTELRRSWATRDIEDMLKADGLVVMTRTRSEWDGAGHHFETGFCHANKMPIVVVGPSPTCFYDLFPLVQTAEQVHEQLRGWAEAETMRLDLELEGLKKADREQQQRARESQRRMAQFRAEPEF